MDAAILGWIAAHRAGWLDGVMWALTLAGSAGAVWIAAAVVAGLADHRRSMAAWQAGLAILLAWTVSDGLIKPLVHRPRPEARLANPVVADRRPSGPSFPSGHASSSAAGALMLSSAWPPGAPAFWLLAAGISVSRVYLGVHYPSDVLAGFAVGLLLAWFVRGRTAWGSARAPRRTGHRFGGASSRAPASTGRAESL
jgi:undecaprenyl-diphosphatase